MLPTRFPIIWKPRDSSLLPVAVAAQGDAAFRLAQRLLQFDDESLARFEGVSGKQLIVVRGPTDLLPWTHGVQYLGSDPSAPSMLYPTNYEPSLPQELVARALAKVAGQGVIAVLPGPLLLIPMGDARPISRQTMIDWLERS